MYPRKCKFWVGAAIGLTLSALAGCGKETSAPVAAAPEVPVIKVQKQDLSIPIEFVGQTKGAVDAEIRPPVEGVIQGVHFAEGKEVKEGDLLYTIDPAPFDAKVAEAQAKVSEAKTRLVKAESDLSRIKPLAEMKAVSERDLDSAVAQEGVARGAVDAANASMESAKIELGYCKIYAPVSGVIGLTKAKVGEFVGRAPNPVVLNTVSQLDPIHVRFPVTEKDYLYFSRLRQEREKAGGQKHEFKLQLELSDGSKHPEPGTVSSVDSQIDPSTGTLMVEASFPNPGKILRPGQFAKIHTVGQTLGSIVAVPKKAIRDLQGTKQIVVITPKNLVEIRTIKTTQEVGDIAVVAEGLAEGELVVPEAQQRLKSGMEVVPKIG